MSKNISQNREKTAATALLSLNSSLTNVNPQSISAMSLNKHASNFAHNTSSSYLHNTKKYIYFSNHIEPPSSKAIQILQKENDASHNLTQQIFALGTLIDKKYNFIDISIEPVTNKRSHDDAIIQQPSKRQKTIAKEQDIEKDRYNLEYYLKIYDERAKALIDIVKQKFDSDKITTIFEKAIQMPKGLSWQTVRHYASGLKVQVNKLIDMYDINSKDQFAHVIEDKTISKLSRNEYIIKCNRAKHHAQLEAQEQKLLKTALDTANDVNNNSMIENHFELLDENATLVGATNSIDTDESVS
jgi:hypothetical protein